MKLDANQAIVLGAALGVIALWSTWVTGSRLANRHGSDIRTLFYFFSLSVVVTALISMKAIHDGIVDGKGNFVGEQGKLLKDLLDFTLDLNADLILFISILAVIVLPQILGYFLSGIFSVAAPMVFVGSAFGFFIWSLVKSFTVACGVLLTLTVVGGIEHWKGMDLKGAFSMLLLSIWMLMVGFLLLYMYRDIANDIATMKKKEGSRTNPARRDSMKFVRWVRNIRSWMTAKTQNEQVTDELPRWLNGVAQLMGAQIAENLQSSKFCCCHCRCGYSSAAPAQTDDRPQS